MKDNLILNTERLMLLPLQLADIIWLHSLMTDPSVRKHLFDDKVIPLTKTADFLQQSKQHFETDGLGLWKLMAKESRTYLGIAGLWSFHPTEQPRSLQVLFPENKGKGYAAEASQAIQDYTRHQLKFTDHMTKCDTLDQISTAMATPLLQKILQT